MSEIFSQDWSAVRQSSAISREVLEEDLARIEFFSPKQPDPNREALESCVLLWPESIPGVEDLHGAIAEIFGLTKQEATLALLLVGGMLVRFTAKDGLGRSAEPMAFLVWVCGAKGSGKSRILSAVACLIRMCTGVPASSDYEKSIFAMIFEESEDDGKPNPAKRKKAESSLVEQFTTPGLLSTLTACSGGGLLSTPVAVVADEGRGNILLYGNSFLMVPLFVISGLCLLFLPGSSCVRFPRWNPVCIAPPPVLRPRSLRRPVFPERRGGRADLAGGEHAVHDWPLLPC